MKKTMPLILFFAAAFCVTAAAQETAAEAAADAVAEAVAPVPEAVAEAAPSPWAVAQAAASAPIEPASPIEFHLGARVGIGVSQFRGHVALLTPDGGTKKLSLTPSLALSAGAITQIGITKLISVAPELQWSLYRASAELEAQNKGSINNKSNNNVYDPRAVIAGVYLHALELPVLARLHFGDVYGELGPMLGLNLYSRIYKNANYYDPDIQLLAFGVAAGGGIELGGFLLGARLRFGIFEYAEVPKGSPWSFEINAGKFFF